MKRMFGLSVILLLCGCGEVEEREPIPMAEAISGRAGYVYSPYTGEDLDVRGKRAGLAMIDVSDELARKLIVPWVEPEVGANMSYAVPVPGRSGYVFNPFTGETVDVRDVPEGMVVTDPNGPSAKHRFRISPK